MKATIFFLILLFGVHLSLSQLTCKWKDSKGNEYDFTPLTNGNVDYFIPKNASPNQPWDIWINVCRTTVSTKCGTDVSACQEWDSRSPTGHASLGKSTSQVYTNPQIPGDNGYGATIQYLGGDSNRAMEIDLVCDKNTDGLTGPIYNNENPQLHYNFLWKSKYACPLGKGAPGTSPSGKVSAAGIILILIFVLLVVYLVAGILIKKIQNGSYRSRYYS